MGFSRSLFELLSTALILAGLVLITKLAFDYPPAKGPATGARITENRLADAGTRSAAAAADRE
jgi:hypothetical protein